ncbi:hypothetical protein KUTeg_013170 [Tegillarca granosa]|uniref:BZIP domain-containing protein n=1 Tax=Tegillarca granosa TaxID=220873 RepID=A0ABQ9EVC7_TEGGR|nr:hypothetical protein KUTeg_013170 [Tegillarca granosa]
MTLFGRRMYNREEQGESYSAESKYVADILSNMASATSTVISSLVISHLFGEGVITSQWVIKLVIISLGLVNINMWPHTMYNHHPHHIYNDYHRGGRQSVPVNASSGQDPLTQSGFVPPIIEPVLHDRSNDRYEYAEAGDPDWIPGTKRARTDRPNGAERSTDMYEAPLKRKSGKQRGDDKYLSPEEADRRKIRRERNKVAAAKCRQRRVDHTNRLVEETEKLEEEKGNLEVEIQSLQQQKDQLEFILQAHRPLCKASHSQNGELNLVKVKAEPNESSTCSAKNLTMSSTQRPSTLALVKRERKEN